MDELQLHLHQSPPPPAESTASPPLDAPPSTSAGCRSQSLVDELATACQSLDISTTIDRLRAMHAKGMLYAIGGVGGVARAASSGLSPLQIVARTVESERSKLLLEILLLSAEPTTREDRFSFQGDIETLEWARKVGQSVGGRRGSSAPPARHLLQLDDPLAVTAWLEKHLSPSSPSPPGPPVPPSGSPRPSPTPASSSVGVTMSPSPDSTELNAAVPSSIPLLEITPPTPVKAILASSSDQPAGSLDRPSPEQPEIRLARADGDEADEGAQGSSGATFASPGETDGGERAHDLGSSTSDQAGTASPAPSLSPRSPSPPARAHDASTSSPTTADSHHASDEQGEAMGDVISAALEDEPKVKLEERSPSPVRSLSDMALGSSQEQERKQDTPSAAHGDEGEDVKPFIGRTVRPSLEQPSPSLEPGPAPAPPSDSLALQGPGITGVALRPSRSRIPQLAAPPPPALRRTSPSNSPAPTARRPSPPAVVPPFLPPQRPASPRLKHPTAGPSTAVSANQVPLGPRARWKHYPTPEFSPPPIAPAPRPRSPAAAAAPRPAPTSPPAPAPQQQQRPPAAAAPAEPDDEWVNPFAGPFALVRQEGPPPPRPPATSTSRAPPTALAPAPGRRSSLKRRAADALGGGEAKRKGASVRWAVPERCVVGIGAGPVVVEEKERRGGKGWGRRGRG